MKANCDHCGTIVKRPPSQIRTHVFCSRSCHGGFLKTQTGVKSLRRTHGGKGTRLYRIWKGMKSRCTNMGPKKKPHGRVAYSLHFTDRGCDGPYIDLSVMPRHGEVV